MDDAAPRIPVSYPSGHSTESVSTNLKRTHITDALKERASFIRENAGDVQEIFDETNLLHFVPSATRRPKKIRAFSTRDVRKPGFKNKWNLRLKKHLLDMSNFYKSGSQFLDLPHARILAGLSHSLPGDLSSIANYAVRTPNVFLCAGLTPHTIFSFNGTLFKQIAHFYTYWVSCANSRAKGRERMEPRSR